LSSLAEARPEPARARKTQDPLLDQNALSVDKLPALAVIFDRFAANLAESISALCGSAAALSVRTIDTAQLFAVLGDNQGTVAAVLHSTELDSRALVIFDRPFVDAVLHIAFGGDAGEHQDTPPRPPSKIELALVERVAKGAANGLEAAFVGFAAAPFVLEKLEPIADLHVLGRRNAPVVLARISFEAANVNGSVLALLPQAALLPLKKKLARDPDIETPTLDPRWAKQMQAGVSFAQIPVKGVLEEIAMNLGEVAELAIGDVLHLRGTGMGRVRLECGGHDLFWCKLGRREDRYTLEIEEPIAQEKSLLDEVSGR
jgi:flagellar motor switch protein FliM